MTPKEQLMEEWRDIPGFPGYTVDCSGRIKGPTGKYKALARTKKGYLEATVQVGGKAKKLRANRAVLLAFNGLPLPGQMATHKNDVPYDNRLENLTWASHRDNMDQMVQRGRSARGPRHGMSKLTVAQVVAIRHKRGKETSAKVASRYGIDCTNVQQIWRRKTWPRLFL